MLGPLLAQGRTATVHAWRPGQVLKLHRQEYDRAAVEREAEIVRSVHAAGAPVPMVREVVALDGRFGAVYDYVGGVPMSEILICQPWRAVSLGRRFARLHVLLHGLRLPAVLPARKVRLEEQIKNAEGLPGHARQAALDALANLPCGDHLCHGDFHPANVLVGGDRDTVIDWTDASRGSPVSDVARTATILLGEAQRVSSQSADTTLMLRKFCSAYLREYRVRATVDLTALPLWTAIVAAARLDEGVVGTDPWLLAQAVRISHD